MGNTNRKYLCIVVTESGTYNIAIQFHVEYTRILYDFYETQMFKHKLCLTFIQSQ